MNNLSTKRISLWSGPRNVSTALLYSFSQRKDTQVYDEPLYANYLSNSDAQSFHPCAKEILKTQERDGQRVVDKVFLGESEYPVLFFKNMAHHLLELDKGFLMQLSNILLIRDPRDMLHSYSKTIKDFEIKDTGYPQLKAICDTLLDQGMQPYVLDSKTLLKNPEIALCNLCEFIGIGFDPGMLS